MYRNDDRGISEKNPIHFPSLIPFKKKMKNQVTFIDCSILISFIPSYGLKTGWLKCYL